MVGVILYASPISSITLKDGSSRDKRTILLADDTDHSIDVTVWGELASTGQFDLGTLVAFKSTRVSEFSGRSLNASSDR